MKRLFLLLLALGLAAGLAWLARNTVDTARFFEARGRVATLVIGERYSTERWARPLPLKKIYTYTALLEPRHEVLIETDQELKSNTRVPIRFLTRDVVGELPASPLRPVANSVRLRGAEDGAPVKVEETDLFDSWVDRAMGPPAEGVRIRPRAAREAPLATGKPTVPFLFFEEGETVFQVLKKNSTPMEWLLFVLGGMAVISLLLSAWQRQKHALLPNTSDKDFVHPSLRRQEADPAAEPSRRISYVPKPDEEIVLPETEKRRMAAEAARAAKGSPEAPPPLPPGTAPAPAAKAVPDEPPSLASNETAPPMPLNKDEPVLKLRRKS